MPLASVATPGAQNCLYNANVRIVRGFDSFTGGQDRLGVLEGWRIGTFALGRATCCTRQR